MARDYAIVTPRFWTGDTGRSLRGDPVAQVVALYLMSSPSANMIGLYYLPLPTLAHEAGIPLEGALEALRRLSEGNFAHYDEAQEVVWVPEMGRHQVAETMKATDKRVAGVVKEALRYRKSRFYQAFVDHYRVAWNLPYMPPGEGATKPLRRPLEGPSKPLRSQDQDQDQEQEQDQAVNGRGDLGNVARAREAPVVPPPPTNACARPAENSPRPPLEIPPDLADPKAAGTRHRAEREAGTPLTLRLLAVLAERGFECFLSPKGEVNRGVERAVRAVTVAVAVERVMAAVMLDRGKGVLPHDSVGWYTDVIAGRSAGGPKAPNPNAMAPVSTDFTETLADLRAERLAKAKAQH